MGAFNQQSQRYVHVGDYDYFVIPPSLDEEKFKDIVKQIVDYYNNEVKNLKDKGKSLEQSQEDARFIIPNAGKTNVIWTTNLRNLIHVSHYRLCNRSQWEIRKLMSLVKKKCKINSQLLPNILHLNAIFICIVMKAKEPVEEH